MAQSASRPTRRRGGSSIMAGVLIGLAIAAALAIGVALWVTGHSPFKSDAPAQKPDAAAGPVVPAVPEPAPSFDFYKVLPGDAPADLPAAPAPAAPVVRYYLQAGAFQNPADADNLKAQLALLGVEATIQTSEVPDKGLFHRVRIGPLSLDEIERTRSLLAQNKIPATLVKEMPHSQETP